MAYARNRMMLTVTTYGTTPTCNMVKGICIVIFIYLFVLPGGPSAAVRSAAIGAVLLALIEGIGICITRMTADQFKQGM